MIGGGGGLEPRGTEKQGTLESEGSRKGKGQGGDGERMQ